MHLLSFSVKNKFMIWVILIILFYQHLLTSFRKLGLRTFMHKIPSKIFDLEWLGVLSIHDHISKEIIEDIILLLFCSLLFLRLLPHPNSFWGNKKEQNWKIQSSTVWRQSTLKTFLTQFKFHETEIGNSCRLFSFYC